MGLIRATISGLSSTLADQYKEYVVCPEVDNDIIIQRGEVRYGTGSRNSTPGVISNGSGIVVPSGMAMMIVDNGAIKEFTSEEGVYTWDNSTEPSIFTGNLWDGIKESFKTWGKRITFGGQAAADQRVYYVNIKEIPSNTFGSPQPEPIYDPLYGSVEITFNGEYSFRVTDPVKLVNRMVGSNAKDSLSFNDIFVNEGVNQLKGKFTQEVSVAIANLLDEKQESFNKVQKYKNEITSQMKGLLDPEWIENYGIEVISVNLRINASESSRAIIQEMDRKVAETTRMGEVYSKNMAGTMAAATGEALKGAATNEGGAMAGFMGMGLAQNMGGSALNAAVGYENSQHNANVFCTKCGNANPAGSKFCSSCGNQLQ